MMSAPNTTAVASQPKTRRSRFFQLTMTRSYLSVEVLKWYLILAIGSNP